MEKVTITKVSISDTDKAGNKLINKFGKPYYKVGIKTNEYGDTFINGLMPFSPDRWEGTTQEVEVFDEEYNGKTYKKFKLPPRAGGTSPEAIMGINRKLDTIITKLDQILGNGKQSYTPDISAPSTDGRADFGEKDDWAEVPF